MSRSRPTIADLTASASRAPSSWKALAELSDSLLAARAYPSSVEMFERATALLSTLGARVRRLKAAQRARGADSGVHGTTSIHTFDLGTVEWLVREYEGDVEIDWSDPHAGEALETLLRPLVFRTEEDGFESNAITMRAWVRAARGPAWPSDLAWVLDTFSERPDVGPSSRARRVLEWDAARVPVRWTLRDAGTAHAMLPTPACTVRGEFRRPPAHAVRAIGSPMRGVRLLRGDDATCAIAIARETLAARCREVHAISFANADEVWRADLGGGSAVVLYGVEPALRLSLEANYGYMLFSNGVPVGYGGVSPLFRQANTGINIFPAFRGTEAAYLWVRALQAFRVLFGVRRFVVNPYQFGAGNAEAIASGAFWFYYRLGFRPATAALRALAAREAAKQRRDRRHRTGPAILRELAGTDLHLTLPGFQRMDAFDEAWLSALALRVTERIAEEGRVARGLALRRVSDAVAERLGVRGAAWSIAERNAFQQLAPLADVIPDLERWPLAARRSLAAMLRAKGSTQEREFARLATRQSRFFRALGAIARDGNP